MPAAPTFRFNARSAFLTYPRSGNITPAELGQFLLSLKPTKYVHVAREIHQDGGYHLHALVQWVEKFHTRTERAFDFQGRHPNIVSPRDLPATVRYITKDVTDENKDTEQFVQGALDIDHKSNTFWEAARDANTYQEVIDNCSAASARDFILNHDKILQYARSKLIPASDYATPDGYRFNIDPRIQTWLDDEFDKEVCFHISASLSYYVILTSFQDRPKSLIVIGPSRIGKTVWARSLGEHIYWGGMTSLDTFNAAARYLIMDDIPFEFVPNKKQWFGAQKTFIATDKYRKKTLVTFGKPLIYLVNPDDDPTSHILWNQWFIDNTVVIRVNTSFY